MANFEAFCYTFSLSTNPQIVRSVTCTTCTWTSNVLSDFNVLYVWRHRMGVLEGFAETQYIIIKIFELFYYFTVQISTKFGVFQVEL